MITTNLQQTFVHINTGTAKLRSVFSVKFVDPAYLHSVEIQWLQSNVAGSGHAPKRVDIYVEFVETVDKDAHNESNNMSAKTDVPLKKSQYIKVLSVDPEAEFSKQSTWVQSYVAAP